MQRDFVWNPNEDYIKRSRLKRFMERYGIKDFNELLVKSTADIEWFWRSVMDDLEIEFYRPCDKVVDLSALLNPEAVEEIKTIARSMSS